MPKTNYYQKQLEQPASVATFIPTAGQQKVFTTDKRFIFAMAGQRGGKTKTGCYWAYLGMQAPGTTGLIAANTYDQLTQSVLLKFFEEFPQLQKYYIKREKLLLLPNQSKVLFRSMEIPELLKGLNLHWIWVDEADGINESTWNIIRSRVATTGGKILCTSSIYDNGWIYDSIYKKNDPDYEIITWQSLENPSFPKSEWDKLQTEMDPIEFAREYGGEFRFASGRVYSDVIGYGLIDDYPSGSVPLATVFGLDFGVGDPTAILVMTYNSDGNWYVVDEQYAPKMDIQTVNHWLEHFITKYGRPYLTVLDSSGGIAKISLTTQANPYDAIKKIAERITLVRSLIFDKRLYMFKRCVNTIREASYYSFEKKDSNKPEGKNDHAMDAMGYVIHTCFTMLEGLSRPQEPEEQMTRFWAQKKEQGIYKGNGKLEDREEGNAFTLDELFTGDYDL